MANAATATAPAEAIEEFRAEEAQAQADFESGMPEPKEPAKPGAAKPETAAKPAATPAPQPKPAPRPEYVQVTRKDWDEVRAAAAKTASYDTQLSKAFGTIGNMQKMLNDLHAAPRGGKIEIPKDAFAAMERDYPELAEQFRAGLEATLRGGTGMAGGVSIDPEEITRRVEEAAEERRIKAEVEALEDEYPDWRRIVGQVDTSKQKPDKNNPFRKWLGTKDTAYQARINGTMSAAVLSRAITRFQDETKAPGAQPPSLQAQLQAARIRGAVQPRGDGGGTAPSRTDDDDFIAGYAAR